MLYNKDPSQLNGHVCPTVDYILQPFMCDVSIWVFIINILSEMFNNKQTKTLYK